MLLGVIEVVFDPHVADWWLVAVSAMAALASFALALFAWLTARRAKEQAARSEKARRDDRDSDRTRREKEIADQREFEYELRLDDAVAELFHSIARYLDLIPAYLAECEEVEIHNHHDGYGNLVYPPDPSPKVVLTSFEVVRLRAKNDTDVYRTLALYLEALLGRPVRTHPNLFSDFVEYLREYRAGVINSDQLQAKVRYLLES